MAIIFPIIFLVVIFLILGGVFAEPITVLIRRRVPHFSYEGEVFLLWGLLVVAAFALGLMVMYLILRP